MKAKEFGEYLRGLRVDRGLTIRQLELYSGVSNGYLSQLETGKRGTPSPEILKKLSGPLKVDYEELMFKAGHLDELTDDERKMFNEGQYLDLADILKERTVFEGKMLSEKEKDLILNIVRTIINQSG